MRVVILFSDVINSSESKLISESDEVEDIVDKNRNLSTVEPPAKNLCGKKASTLTQSKRPDWDSRSFRSRSDVTALLSPDSLCSVVNHTKLGFKGAQKFEDLTKSKNFCG